jgi:hypothetical protein
VDPRLKAIIEELGAVISESISESQEINRAITRIRSAGFDTTIVFNAAILIKERNPEPPSHLALTNGDVECTFNAQDLMYLKSLHISVNR